MFFGGRIIFLLFFECVWFKVKLMKFIIWRLVLFKLEVVFWEFSVKLLVELIREFLKGNWKIEKLVSCFWFSRWVRREILKLFFLEMFLR